MHRQHHRPLPPLLDAQPEKAAALQTARLELMHRPLCARLAGNSSSVEMWGRSAS